MSNDTRDYAHQLDDMVREYLAQARELEEGNLAYATQEAVQKAQHAEWQRTHEGGVARLYEEIVSFIKSHEDDLIAKGKRSFATSAATFQFTTIKARPKVLDSQAILQKARKMGVVKQVATPPRTGWKFSAKLFWNFLQKNPTKRQHFEQWIEHGQEHESLTIKPNKGHDVTYDPGRISPLPVTPPRTSPA